MNDSFLLYPSHISFSAYNNESSIPALKDIIPIFQTPPALRNDKQLSMVQNYCKYLKFFKSLLEKEKKEKENRQQVSLSKSREDELYPNKPDFAYHMPHEGSNPLPFVP